jgi:hypothetical protein
MNKKDYQKPTMKVVKLQHKCHIMAGSPYETSTSGQGNTSIMEMEDVEDL